MENSGSTTNMLWFLRNWLTFCLEPTSPSCHICSQAAVHVNCSNLREPVCKGLYSECLCHGRYTHTQTWIQSRPTAPKATLLRGEWENKTNLRFWKAIYSNHQSQSSLFKFDSFPVVKDDICVNAEHIGFGGERKRPQLLVVADTSEKWNRINFAPKRDR